LGASFGVVDVRHSRGSDPEDTELTQRRHIARRFGEPGKFLPKQLHGVPNLFWIEQLTAVTGSLNPFRLGPVRVVLVDRERHAWVLRDVLRGLRTGAGAEIEREALVRIHHRRGVGCSRGGRRRNRDRLVLAQVPQNLRRHFPFLAVLSHDDCSSTFISTLPARLVTGVREFWQKSPTSARSQYPRAGRNYRLIGKGKLSLLYRRLW